MNSTSPTPAGLNTAPGYLADQPRHCQRGYSQAGVSAEQIASIGITNQRETTVLWDRQTGEPIHMPLSGKIDAPQISATTLKTEGLEPMVSSKTGLLLDPYFSATKIAWLLDNVSGARDRAERGELAFGTMDSWLLWNLTGGKSMPPMPPMPRAPCSTIFTVANGTQSS